MSRLGIFLLVLVFLAGGGFAYLALQDYYGEKGKGNGRQNITGGVIRHVLLLSGLPLEGGPDQVPSDPEAEVPFRVEVAGLPVDTVSPKLLQAYFAQAGGAAPVEGSAGLATNTPVASQLAEVKRVYALVKALIEKQDGPGQRARLAGNVLLLQAENYDERVQVLAWMDPQRPNADALVKHLYGKFDRVIANADPKERPPEAPSVARDRGERKARVAHLLAHLDRDPAWQKRVVLVVGLREYVRAVNNQATNFLQMAARVERLILDDQDTFAADYALARGLAIERTQLVRDMAEVRSRWEEQLRKDQDFVNQRKTQLAQLRTQLERVKAEVDALLARQTAAEQELFAVEREVALTLEDIYRLEAELEKKEAERYGPKK